MSDTNGVDVAAFDSEFQNFNVGARLQLRVQRDAGAVEHFSSLIGFVKNEFVMVKLPMVRSMPFAFYDGEPILVRAFTGMKIHSFTSTVLRTFVNPLNYMHLAFPKAIQSSSLRSELRVKTNLSASVTYKDVAGAKKSAQVPLINLSLSGAAIDCQVPLTVGEQLQMSFVLQSEGADREIRTQATVRSVNSRSANQTYDSSAYICGLQFEKLAAEDMTAIRLLTYETILMNRQNIV
ncbi:MAG: flagellar brake protein [Burkholderiaceae bacterium]